MSTLTMALATAPAILLMVYVYKKDKIEREPIGLLLKLAVFGALSIIPAVLGEMIGCKILGFFANEGSLVYAYVENFLIVAVCEECSKYYMLKEGSWKNRAFNFRFDGVVYGVCTSLGFALVENIMYVANGGIGTALMRAVTAVPGHAMFGVFMGLYYGKAKYFFALGEKAKSDSCRKKAVALPILIHGFYDFCLSVESSASIACFFLFIIFLYVVSFTLIKRAAAEDRFIIPTFEPQEENLNIQEIFRQ